MKELISNVFAIECFPLIYEHATGKKDKTSKKWKNIMKSYPLFVKRFHLEKEMLPFPISCVTLGGMWFFWFLSFQDKYDESVRDFLNEKQGADKLEEFILWQHGDSSCIFQEIVALKGSNPHIVSNKPFNESLVHLIETYQIIPQNATEGIIWVLNTERDDLCHLETILKKYSAFMG